MRKSIAIGMLAVAAAGSLAFGGTALAHGGGGDGGAATNDCINVGVPVLSGLGVAGQGSAVGASCTAVANGGNG